MRTENYLPEGKLPTDALGPILKGLGRKGLVVAPVIGVDVGVTKSRGKYLVSSSDPITGAETRMGWHAVHVSANDVATSGIMPDALNVVCLFPKGVKLSGISELMTEIGRAADQIGVTVAGGHTEVTPGLRKPIIVVTCFGSGEKFVTSAKARSSDSILMTKTAGIEGTSILSNLRCVGESLPRPLVDRARNLIEKLSVIAEANAAFSTGDVHAMHDVTEGGVLGAIMEMGIASRLDFELDFDKVPVDRSTKRICELLHLDPLSLIGSGSLIIACAEDKEPRVACAVRGKGIPCTRIGRFTSGPGRNVLIRSDSRGRLVRRRISNRSIGDELWRALRKYSC